MAWLGWLCKIKLQKILMQANTHDGFNITLRLRFLWFTLNSVRINEQAS
ncbi:hypothetical protein ES703_100273 [subsurface metagenome]